MPFTANNIHGWNPIFREENEQEKPRRFFAFEWAHNRPNKFYNQILPGPYTGSRLYDHQGHIVPQNLLSDLLFFIANAAFRSSPRPDGLADLNVFLITAYPELNFQSVTNYIEAVLIGRGGAKETIFVDSEADNIEDYIGGYFSVMMWNPVNICRAPSDNFRAGAPGENVDRQVIDFIIRNPNQQGIDVLPQMAQALELMLDNPLDNIENYISVNNATLENQILFPSGYYKFNWQDQKDAGRLNQRPLHGIVLIPGPPGF